ncbi:MAG: hypothetical protein KQJ78_06200 [Deltaproteobacteria bacterium]|nr:hypothetical protein [Deltaproteobacteria bacterium]
MNWQAEDPHRLTEHPDYARLFLPAEAAELAQLGRDMAQGERFPPWLINPQGQVLAGVEHWRAALGLGWEAISVVRSPALSRSQERALMVAENIRWRELRPEHLNRGMNNFFDMEPLRPPGGW